jgi:hypothetical protein
MILVLCHSDDLPALWAYRELARLHRDVQLVTADALAYALTWEHRITSADITTSITLANGRTIRSGDVTGTLNRLHTVPGEHLAAAGADRAYAEMEIYALFASWLAALPGPVLNAASPSGLCGSTWRSPSEWVVLARQAGLPVLPRRESGEDDPDALMMPPPYEGTQLVLVAGDDVIGGNAPPDVCERAGNLARRNGLSIAGVFFHVDRGIWRFHSLTLLPDLRVGGARTIDALSRALTASECFV